MVNLRFMCHCLARAIKLHLDFNATNATFLQDISDTNDFTYNFKPDLKLTLNPQQQPQAETPGQIAIQLDIDKQLIEIQAKLQDGLDRTLVNGLAKVPLNDADDFDERDDFSGEEDDQDEAKQI